jgi:single-stranded-DNA-specific exonuclease
VQLLTTDNHYHAVNIARELVAENKRRQRIQEQTVEEAVYQVHAEHDLDSEMALVLAGEGWHQGVIGIVAARIRDLFQRPTAIISLDNGVGKGSLRSMAGFDLYDALSKCGDLLLGYGGHKVAAGMSVSADQLPAFAERFVSIANDTLTADQLAPRQILDGECELKIIDSRFIRFLNSLEPYGPGNRRPVLASRGVESAGTPRLVGEQAMHLKCSFRQDGVTFDAIGFDLADHYEKLLLNKPLDIAYVVEENEWNGKRSIQLQIKDIKLGAAA